MRSFFGLHRQRKRMIKISHLVIGPSLIAQSLLFRESCTDGMRKLISTICPVNRIIVAPLMHCREAQFNIAAASTN